MRKRLLQILVGLVLALAIPMATPSLAADLTITTSSALDAGVVGIAYSQTLAVSGGVAPYLWSVQSGVLPAGLSLSSSGAITGTADAAGDFSVTISVTDSFVPANAVSKTLTLKVYLPGDANGDGLVDMADAIRVERIILGRDSSTPGADANNDGVINIGDLVKIERMIVGLP